MGTAGTRLYRARQRAVLRLEQSVAATTQRALVARGALALLYGKHLRFYMSKVEVRGRC